MRQILELDMIHSAIREKIAHNRREIVDEVQAEIGKSRIVVVGMAQNPHCRRARRILDMAGRNYAYLEFGSYLNNWRRRNALKMWTGWPTFPMVFVDGVLIGGADELTTLIKNGELDQLLAGPANGAGSTARSPV